MMYFLQRMQVVKYLNADKVKDGLQKRKESTRNIRKREIDDEFREID